MNLLPKTSGLLIVEDDPQSADLMQRVLRRNGYKVHHAASLAEAHKALEEASYSAILLDYRLPEGESWPLLDHIQVMDRQLPVVFITAMGDERVASEAIRRGAADYVIKSGDFWDALPSILERVICAAEAEIILRRSEQLHNAILAALPASIALLDAQGRIVTANRAWQEMAGTGIFGDAEDAEDASFYELCRTARYCNSETAENVYKGLEHVLRGTSMQFVQELQLCPPGAPSSWHRLIIVPVSPGQEFGAVVMYVDITERVKTENALQSQTILLHNVFRCMGEGICVVDQEGRLLQHNPKAEEILNVQLEGSSTTPWTAHEFYHEDRTTLYQEQDFPWQKAIGGEYVPEQEMFLTEKDSSEGRFISITAAPLWAEQDELRGGIAVFRDITQRKKEELERQRLVAAVEQAAEVIVITDTEFRIVYANPAYEAVTGIEFTDVTGAELFQKILCAPTEKLIAQIRHSLSTGEVWRDTLECKKASGDIYSAEISITPVLDARDITRNYACTWRDVTKELELQHQLNQSQKMEAIGQLAGGVAHDFNNLLTVIKGYGEMVQDALDPDSPQFDALNQALKAAESASTLTRQLLAFARKQVLRAEQLSLNEVVVNVEKILSRLLEEDIQIALQLDPGLQQVVADPGQVEQILVNLVVNARDAMPEGGLLQIITRNETVDEDFAEGHFNLTPGRYVMLSVSDTGCGMDEETRAHIFEPFFTTKPLGQGTGLGLSTVYGIVQQSEGHIWVYSEPGQGTAVKIFFPAIEKRATQRPRTQKEDNSVTGNETILVVEDNQPIRELVTKSLTLHGYEVYSAANSSAAMALASKIKQPLALLITDVVMPGESGPVLREKLAKVHPDAKVLYMSGYTRDIITHRGEFDTSAPLLQKPFTPRTLLKVVRELLDTPEEIAGT